MAIVSYTHKMSLLLGGRVSIKPSLISSSIQRCFSVVTTGPLSTSSPWLMVPPTLVANHESDIENCNIRSPTFKVKRNSETKPEDNDYYHFLNVANNKVSCKKEKKDQWIPLHNDCFSPKEATCIGSSHGWLAYIHPHNCALYLYNPFNDSSSMPYLPLPPIETLPPIVWSRRLNVEHIDPSSLSPTPSPSPSVVTEFTISKKGVTVPAREMSEKFIRKLAMSSAPTDGCIAMAIYNESPRRIAMCRIGDRSWTGLNSKGISSYTDLIYFSKKDIFYAVCSVGSVESWDLTDPSSPICCAIWSEPPRCHHITIDDHQKYWLRRESCITYYLVESSGELLMVVRYYKKNSDSGDKIVTKAFDVFKRDFINNEWVHVPSLGDRVLFIGKNESVSLSADDFPGLSRNSIYFTAQSVEHYLESICDMGVYSLQDDDMESFDLEESEASPVWVIPQL